MVYSRSGQAPLKSIFESDRESSATIPRVRSAERGILRARNFHGERSPVSHDNTSDQCYLGYALAKAGRRSEAEAILKRLESTKEYVSPAELADLYVGLDRKEQALSALERAYAAHDLQMQFLGVDQHLDPLRSEPRFQELIRKVGLPQ